MNLLPIALALFLLPVQDPVGAGSPPALDEVGPVVVVPIKGALTEASVALTIRAFRMAREVDAAALVIQLDTPGGELTKMDRIVEQIEDAVDLPTAAYITQMAASAGSLIALSCDRIFMRPGSIIGAARPYNALRQLPIDLTKFDELRDSILEIEEKMKATLRSHFRAKAQRTGRNEALAEAMVDQDIVVYEIELEGVRDFVTEKDYREMVALHGEDRVHRVREVCGRDELLSVTAQEAYDLELADALVQNLDDVLSLMQLEGATIIQLELSWSEILAEKIQSLWLLFLVLGLLMVFIELKVPGFGVPGLLGVLCFALLFFGKYLSGLANATEILLIIVGFGLVAAEIFLIPGTFVAGILGVIAILAGIVLSFQTLPFPSIDAPPWQVEKWWDNLYSLGWAFAGGVLGMYLVAHFMPHIPILRNVVLKADYGPGGLTGSGAMVDDVHRQWRPTVGARGISRCPLRPAGKIEVDGRQLDAVAEGQFVEDGVEVKIVRVEGNRIVVRTIA